LSSGHEQLRVVRIIARLNIGGPAIQAITLTKELRPFGYRTTLVRGTEDPGEGNMDYLAGELGVTPKLVPALRRNLGHHDIPALLSLIRILRRERPHIVHTHAAKAGTLGRVAALIATVGRRPRPVLIHTYHGHSLHGYFSSRMTELFRRIERFLARATDVLIAVSDEVRDELVARHVAPASKFAVVPLGFDLSGFAVNGTVRQQMREAVRSELGIPQDARVVTMVARLVPIKRVDRFLSVASALNRQTPDLFFLIVGDGELRARLTSSPDAQALSDRLVWAGFRRDIPAVLFASDVVVQTSDNEGTPVSLIEAQAAGVPVVSTQVGGVASLVPAARLAAPHDTEALARAIHELVNDRSAADTAAKNSAVDVQSRFALGRLARDLDRLYRHELSRRSGGKRQARF
jgi:glycosyltransferase involved in cell wall biosynthesis